MSTTRRKNLNSQDSLSCIRQRGVKLELKNNKQYSTHLGPLSFHLHPSACVQSPVWWNSSIFYLRRYSCPFYKFGCLHLFYRWREAQHLHLYLITRFPRCNFLLPLPVLYFSRSQIEPQLTGFFTWYKDANFISKEAQSLILVIFCLF